MRKTMSLAMIGVLVLAAGCDKKAKGGWGEMVVPVVAASAKQQAVEEAIEAVGTLAANESVDIKSELDGVVEEIGFAEGQRVEAGAVLFRIDRNKLQASLAEAEANLKMAEATLGRYTALAESRAVSQQEVDQARTSYEARLAGVALMRAQLEDATVTAPFAGVVGARLVSIGQYVTRGQQLSSLVEVDPMKVEFGVPERFLGQVKPQQAVKLDVAAYPETPFTGEVYFIGPQVEAATRTVPLKATVPNPDGRLRQGMFAHVELIVRIKERAVVIPDTALLHQGDLTFVYVIDAEQKAQMRPVKIGVRLANVVEVIEGLQASEQVVAEGHQKLHPGAKVEPRQPDSQTEAPNPA